MIQHPLAHHRLIDQPRYKVGRVRDRQPVQTAQTQYLQGMKKGVILVNHQGLAFVQVASLHDFHHGEVAESSLLGKVGIRETFGAKYLIKNVQGIRHDAKHIDHTHVFANTVHNGSREDVILAEQPQGLAGRFVLKDGDNGLVL